MAGNCENHSWVTLPGVWGGVAEATVMCWANSYDEQRSVAGRHFQALIESVNNPVQTFVHLQLFDAGNCTLYLDASANSILLTIPPDGENRWRHYAISATTGDTRIYVDGVQVGATDTTAFGVIDATTSGAMRLGNGRADARPLIGALSRASIGYARLTPAQIAALAGAASASAYDTLVAATASLQGYWKLDEADATTTATDSSGNGRHGTYVGGPHNRIGGPFPGVYGASLASCWDTGIPIESLSHL